jgi:HAD superfamily hydrolase (TIGR01509 family)
VAQPKLRAIIFDIGRVLIRVDVARAMEGLSAGTSLSPAEIWSAIEKDPRWPDLQDGRMSANDWYLHLTRRLGVTLTFAQFTEAWNRALDPNPIQDYAFLEALSKRYKMALLSNTDPIHVRHMEGSYKFFELFPVRIYSCAVGCSKPNPLIFQAALKALKVQANEALFIDDIEAYVEGAKGLGMSAIQFKSAAQLASDLAMHGVVSGQVG